MKKYIEIAQNEIISPTFEVTKQYLETFDIEYENNRPKVHRVDIKYSNDLVAIYFNILNQQFFLEIHVNKKNNEVDFIYVQDATFIKIKGASQTFNYSEILNDLKIDGFIGGTIGDKKAILHGTQASSYIEYTQVNDPSINLEEKIDNICQYLLKHRVEIQKLRNKLDFMELSICIYKYTKNGCIGGFSINNKQLKKLSTFDISIDIDIYVGGELIR